MTESDFSGDWFIRSSTSRFFPADSKLVIREKKPGAADFELAVTWEKFATLNLIEKDFLLEDGVLKGSFRRPEDEQGEEEFQLVVTLCPASFADGKRRLLGLLLSVDRRIEPGSTGVWVAEEQQPPKPPKR